MSDRDYKPERTVLPWFAVRVKSNFESVTSAMLRGKGYEEFLPLCRSRRRWSDRVKEMELPLFPGYVFCRFNPTDRLPVLATPGVVSIVGIGKVPVPVEEEEIASVQAIIRSGLAAQRWPYLQAGERVYMERGPLAGLEGVVLLVKNEWRLVVSISLLQRSVSTEIERDWVRPVAPARCSGAVQNRPGWGPALAQV